MEIEISKELKIYNKNNNFKISLPKNNFDVSLLINKAGKCWKSNEETKYCYKERKIY